MVNITVEDIKNLIQNHKEEAKKDKNFYRLYKGHHAVLHKKVSDENKPNNKTVNAFFSLIVDSLTGFFLGKPITINHNTSDKIQDELNDIFVTNNKDDLFSEIAKECSIKGKSYLLVYQDEAGITRLVRVPAEEMIVQKDSNGKPVYAVRYYSTKDLIENKTIMFVEVYTTQSITYYQSDDNGDFYFVKSQNHIFKQVPVIVFQNNEEEQGDIEKVESLVNNYDMVLSFSADEQEAYRNTYLALRGMIVNEETMKRLNTEGIMELQEGGDAFFIKKEIQVESIREHLDRLERNIHKFAHVPDFTDPNAFGNVSGVALKTKLKGMEDKIRTKTLKFKKAINQLLELLAIPIQVKTGELLKVKDMDIQFSPNIPQNETEEIDNAIKLTSIISTETAISRLPFVTDPMAEMEKKQEEEQGEAGSYPDFHMSSVDRQTVPNENDNVAV